MHLVKELGPEQIRPKKENGIYDLPKKSQELHFILGFPCNVADRSCPTLMSLRRRRL